MFGHTPYYNETVRKYVALFGTLFNDIVIFRKDNNGTEVQRMKVPLAYGPTQKFLSKTEEDPDHQNRPQIRLPRMSFQIVDFQYDSIRARPMNSINKFAPASGSTYSTNMSPVPYNLEIELSIMAKYDEDGLKIIEQILPFFRPHWSSTAQLIDGVDMPLDIFVQLNSISPQNDYEGPYDENRVLIWTLSFTLKGYLFGPMLSKKIIKFAQVNMYANTQANTESEIVKVYPGLTANGEPSTDPNNTIDYLNINEDDNWGYIVTIEEASANNG